MEAKRREEIRAMLAKPTWSVPILELQSAIVDAMDWIDQLEAKAAERVITEAKAPAVVASNVRLALEHLLDAMDASFTGWGRGSRFRHIEELKVFARKALSESPAVPTNRVLGDGMVQVSASDLKKALEVVDSVTLYIWDVTPKEDVSGTALRLAFQPIKDALRANQGEATT